MAEEFNTQGMLDMYLFENGQLLERLQEIVLEQKDEDSFDEDSINEILNATEMEVEGELKCSEMDLDVDGVNFTDKNVISIKQSSETTTKFDLDSSFDALVLEEPTTGYVGMGLNGEIVNRESDLCIYEPFTNKLLGFRRGAMGDSFNLDDLQWDSIPNTEIGGYYYDKEFTQPVEEDLVFPSYDRDIYAKIVPVQGLTVLAVHTEYYNEYKDDTTNYTSSNSAGTYINNIEEGYKIKEIFVNGKVYEGNWEDGFKYDANTFYYIDIILENAEQ